MPIISNREELSNLLAKLDYHRVQYLDPSIPDSAFKGNPEMRRRIQIAVWAWAYEVDGETMVSDQIFDEIAHLIDPSISLGCPIHDAFFREQFSPYTGMWVHNHPDPQGLAVYYQAWLKHRYS